MLATETSSDAPLLVDAAWLADTIGRVIPIDGTWSMPNDTASLPNGFIPGSRVFDLDTVATPHPTLNHMLPDAKTFAQTVGDMGVSAEDHVVVYDRHGVFSSPRLWWTFKMFGHAKVSVLNGGLPAWIAAGHSVEKAVTDGKAVTYVPSKPLAKVVSKAEVLAALGTDAQIIDARPPGRFDATSPEPRAELRGGHMPGANNVPFGSLRTADSHFKDIEALIEAFASVDPDAPIITSCGSGITAAGLAFVLAMLGADDVSVYDGSWAEWGADSDVPIVGS
ncbi:sulfurtransferase [Fretibacter rubidus]|uniref:sulfurtransferase n=1 Tax=Fretibacter rubidus TaxID=570162 RepID=UPI00352B903A